MKKLFFFAIITLLSTYAFAQVSVTFRVDMSVQAKKGLFNVATDPVKIAGDFNGWNNGANVLTKGANDTIYSATISGFTVGSTINFKFIKGADGWENDPNRQFVIPAGGGTYSCWFNNDSIYVPLTPVSVTFACNMEFEIVSNRFNPATDTLSARGSFNGWSNSTKLFPSSLNPNIYEGVEVINTFAGETINYKFAYQSPGGTTWENDPNKTYTFTAGDISSGSALIERTFNNLDLSSVTNQPTTIKFTVNVVGAVSSITGQPFTSITDVRLCGANAPLKWPDGGWPDADSNKTIKLYDNGTNGDVTAGDQVWSRDVTFPQYSGLRVQYKYGANWGLPTNTGGNDNESSVGTDHFINFTPNLVSARVANIWGQMGDHELLDVVVGVEDGLSTVPDAYSLGQNYPNPFNPSTQINFALPSSGYVTLKVYNLIGQEVATLINGYMEAGSHYVNFNASGLTSGIYFYSINAGNFTSTKKMILMK